MSELIDLHEKVIYHLIKIERLNKKINEKIKLGKCYYSDLEFEEDVFILIKK